MVAPAPRESGGRHPRTAEVSRKLHSEDFDALARTFERVAYGGEDAAAGDVAASREGWKRVVTAAAR